MHAARSLHAAIYSEAAHNISSTLPALHSPLQRETSSPELITLSGVPQWQSTILHYPGVTLTGHYSKKQVFDS